jgi:tripeptidyl-peptidase II
MKKRAKLLPLILGSLLLQACAPESDKGKTRLIPSDQVEPTRQVRDDQRAVIKQLQTEVVKLYNHPSLTLILVPKGDLQTSIKSLITGGGKLVYDPNQGVGNSIPFYIAELKPEQINDSKFMGSLNIKAAQIDNANEAIRPIETKISSTNLDVTNFIPKDSVRIGDLLSSGETLADLGENTTVAVIDTGIDASHPGFEGRVVYWYDGTQETRTELKEVEVSAEGEISLNNKKLALPKNLPEGKVFAAIMQEKDFYSQLSATSKASRGYLDLNYNNSSDEFLVVAVKTSKGIKIYFDADGDLSFNKNESTAKIDYNETKATNRKLGMIAFPSRNNIIEYPLLVEEEDGKLFLGLGKCSGMHGTHVAGIIAANDAKNNLEGVAPKANLMSLRVCSEISCTDSAIIKALYKTFYNGKVIPDVVNISLGSHERFDKGVYSHLFDDLSAKFGTIFFVSASNSGPGFRSLNHIGNTGAVVTVGANVSDKTLRDQYNLPAGLSTQNEAMLYFSSLGPSYTGEMKPNIVAPGAAISTVLTAEGYMSQANGTSMSSPLAAGAMAAILGKIKKENISLLSTISDIRQKNTLRSGKSAGTLLPYVYAMRDALQQTAFEQADLTRAQQGYGLIQAGSAKYRLQQLMEELSNDQKDYFEVVLNNYQTGYDREEVKPVKAFALSLGVDGERSKESLAGIISRGVDVVLDRVEILNHDGTVLKPYDLTEYFYLVDQGDAQNKKTQTHVTFNNRRTPTFYSKRRLENMQTGLTYLAHYKVMQRGAVVQNILDVVHRPISLTKQEAFVPAIDAKTLMLENGYAKKDVTIKANTSHRYPIMIDGTMTRVKVKVAIPQNAQGIMYVQLYDPRGKEMAAPTAINTPINANTEASLDVTTLLNGKIREGIWELTISTASSTWLSDSRYDLVIEADTFGTQLKEVALKAGELTEVPVRLAGHNLAEAFVVNLKQAHKEKVTVKSGYVSFHPLVLKEDHDNTVTLMIEDSKSSYWGVISHSLYTKNGDGFKPYTAKVSTKEVSGGREFKIGKTTEQLYFALETIINYNMEAGLSNSVASSVDVVSVYNHKVATEIKTTIDNHSAYKMAMVKLTAAKDLGITPMLVEAKTYLTGTLLLLSGQKNSIQTNQGSTLIDLNKYKQVQTVNLTVQD